MSYAMIDPKTLVVLVTGATSGFGEALARRYVAEGAKVVATGRRVERLDALKAELGDALHVAALDVRDPPATETLLEGLPDGFRNVNVVIANAGLALGLGPAQTADIADWHTMIDTNVTGFVNTVRASLPGLIARGGGHIITIGSVAGDYPYPGGNVYAGTKAFVKQFARRPGQEGAHHQHRARHGRDRILAHPVQGRRRQGLERLRRHGGHDRR
jgi:3-hydroxy acid dehydrogenase / malonic semialdehyde reductase